MLTQTVSVETSEVSQSPLLRSHTRLTESEIRLLLKESRAALSLCQRLAESVAPQLANEFDVAKRQLESDTVGLVFGGYFKSGKSSTLNAALRRNLLSIGSLPETGAICQIEGGAADRAMVVTTSARFEISCEPESIQQYTTLVDALGRRRDTRGVCRIEITLQGSVPPKGQRWVDSPGIQDTEAMDDCARRAASEGDQLFWVFNSKQPIASTERAFLAEHFAKYGHDSVVFVLNSFLSEDTPEAWERFQQRELKVIQTRLSEAAADWNLPAGKLQLVALSARALTTQSSQEYGRANLEALMRDLGQPNHIRILRTRLFRLLALLTSVEAVCEDDLHKKQQARARQQQQIEAAQREAARLQTLFEEDVRSAIRRAISQAKINVLNEGTQATNSLLQADFTYGDTHGDNLNQTLRTACASAQKAFSDEIAQLCNKHNRMVLTPSSFRELQSKLVPRRVSVDTPYSTRQASDGTKEAVIGGALGAPLGFFGIAVGAAIGKWLGSNDGEVAARAADYNSTKANMHAATQKALTDLDRCEPPLFGDVMTFCPSKDSLPVLDDTAYHLVETRLQMAQQVRRVFLDLYQRSQA